MDRSSFQKIFRELYSVNPSLWNTILEKSGKTKYSKKGDNTKKAVESKGFSNLMNADYNKFTKFSKKANAQVDKPKSIRVDGSTLSKADTKNTKDISYVDSSAIDSFNIKDNGDGTKDVSITFNGGGKDYLYPDVPANVANGMYAAPSKGTYVDSVISKYSDYSNPKVQEKIRSGQ